MKRLGLKVTFIPLLSLLFCMVSTKASAYDVSADYSGKTIYYNYINNATELEVTHWGYNTYSGNVTIPKSVTISGKTLNVTSIGEDAFYRSSGLTGVTIPNTITKIDDYAFAFCMSLTKVTIPGSVMSIGDCAFLGCYDLSTIVVEESNPYYDSRENCNAIIRTDGDEVILVFGCKGTHIPNSVTTIGRRAFGYSDIAELTIPNSVTVIEEEAFIGTEELTELTIADGESLLEFSSSNTFDNNIKKLYLGRNINISPFSNKKSIETLTIGDKVTTIVDNAFSNCNGIKTYVIGDHVTTIGENAFKGCSGFETLVIGDNITTIGAGAFSDCTGMTSVTFGKSVTTVGLSAFSGCTGLKKVITKDLAAWCGIAFEMDSSNPLNYAKHLYSDENTEIKDLVIPNSVTNIGNYTFCYCTGLTSITIHNNVTNIGQGAFVLCTGLTSVKIPNSVTNIGPVAFYFCTNLSSVTIGSGVTTIGLGAFQDCSSLTSITIPDNVGTLDAYVFRFCTNLNTVIIGGGVTSIGEGAFYNCNSLTKVIIKDIAAWCGISFGDNPLSIAGHLYSDENTEITNLVIPDGVTSISNNAFYGCSDLTSVTIPNSVTSIGDKAFLLCNSLTKVIIKDLAAWCGITFDDLTANPLCYAHHLYNEEGTELIDLVIPDGVKAIGNYAFFQGANIASLIIPNSVKAIGQEAFYNCSSLVSVNIPENITTIEEQTFYGCKSLTSVIIPNSVTTIGKEAFYNCSSLASVNIPENVTTIKEQTFYGCNSLTSIIIPNSVTTIGKFAFQNCSNLASIIIGNGVTTICQNAFRFCSSIEKIIINTQVPPTCEKEVFYGASMGACTLIVSESGLSAYQTTDPWYGFNIIKDKVSITMSGLGMATYCSGIDLDFTGMENVKAYVASIYSDAEGAVKLTPVDKIPAGTGFALIGNPGAYEVPCRSTSASYDNLLKGTLVEQPLPMIEGEYTNYILANGSSGLGFYKSSGNGSIAANKSYLQLPTLLAQSRSMIYIDGDDNTTDINLPHQETLQTDAVYNLNGQRMGQPQNGVYVKRGKKFIIRKK